MSSVRAGMWSLTVGVMAVLLAALLFRIAPLPGAAFVALLAVSTALVSLLAALFAEVPASVGVGGGVFGAALVAVVLGLTIAAAPLAPGAQRPGLADLLWLPLFALIAALALCALAGLGGVRAGLRLARRRKP